MVNVNLVEAQQARRVLDRLVVYKISPLLGTKGGAAFPRARTDRALRLIVERERLIRAFRKRKSTGPSTSIWQPGSRPC